MNTPHSTLFRLGDATPASGGTSQRLYESLRQRIITFDLPPDTMLSRNEVAEAYGVSQTPLREALLRLQQDGLVRIFPQSRTVVTRIDIPQIHEAHFLRIALECEVARALALSGGEQAVTRARSIIRMQEAVAEDRDQITLFQELDEVFHQTLFATLGRVKLHQLVRERSGHLERVRRLHLPEPGKIASILEGHHRMVDAIARTDDAAAVAATREHLSKTVERLEDMRAEYPDYFV